MKGKLKLIMDRPGGRYTVSGFVCKNCETDNDLRELEILALMPEAKSDYNLISILTRDNTRLKRELNEQDALIAHLKKQLELNQTRRS